MKVVMFLMLVYAGGEADIKAFVFPSMLECEEKLAELPKVMGLYNQNESPKIDSYAAKCAQVTAAPQGELKV